MRDHKSWTKEPNVVFDTPEKVEEAYDKEGVSRELAGLGCIAAALDARPPKNIPPTFLYPKIRSGLDTVALAFVKKLGSQDFKAPGISVKLDTYGPYTKVGEIEGDTFKMVFSRIQGRADTYWNDTAGLARVCIPKKQISMYDDSGPILALYVGNEWESDKKQFEDSSIYGCAEKPGTCTCYTGLYRGGFSPVLKIHEDRYGGSFRDGTFVPFYRFVIDGNEPKTLKTADVMKEFEEYLGEQFLKME